MALCKYTAPSHAPSNVSCTNGLRDECAATRVISTFVVPLMRLCDVWLFLLLRLQLWRGGIGGVWGLSPWKCIAENQKPRGLHMVFSQLAGGNCGRIPPTLSFSRVFCGASKARLLVHTAPLPV